MDLIQFDGSDVILRLYPSDCATLAQVLALAEVELVEDVDQPLREAAGNYAALFRALSLGTMSPGRLMPWNRRFRPEDLGGPEIEEEKQ
ncbi:MAG: hypothetical protein JXM73_00270 [Anaerolineae bacterium]|nr:hypothetical protein [Anaerolineae bacterium]